MREPVASGAARGALIDRPRLRERLSAGGSRRVSVLIGGAGFGKSSLARHWLDGRQHAWLSLTERDGSVDAFTRRWFGALADAPTGVRDPDVRARIAAAGREAADDADRAEAVAELLAGTLIEALSPGQELPVVLDDLHVIASRPASAIVSGLVRRLPPAAPILITSRTALPFPVERLRAHGDLVELSGDELAFDAGELEGVLVAALGPAAATLTTRMITLTAGWPAAVRLLVEGLRRVPTAERPTWLAGRATEGSLFPYLAEEVLAHEPAATVELIRTLAPHPTVDLPLCAALALPDAASIVADLERRGMFIVRDQGDGTFALHDLIRAFAAEYLPLPADRLRQGQQAAIAWHERRGDAERALRLATTAGDRATVEGLMARHARRLLAVGRVDAVVDAASAIPEGARSLATDLAIVDGLTYRGQGPEALARLERLSAADARPVAAVAWRMARIHLQQGEVARAAAVVEGVEPSGDPTEDALLFAHAALARFFGVLEGARDAALKAAALADRQDDLTARSIAHMAAAYTLREHDPATSRAHYRQALEAAEQAGDVVQIVRLRNADDDGATVADQYAAATESLALIEAAGNPAWFGNTLVNRGVLGLDLGRFEAAEADLERARRIASTTAPATELIATAFLAELARMRGGMARATVDFRRVIEAADAAGDANVSSFARAGLARVLARTDPDGAHREIARSLDDAVDVHLHDYLLADAWIAACQDRPDDARRQAREVIVRAGSSPGRAAALASALEVEAMVTADAAARAAGLREALTVWERIGNAAAASVTRLALAVTTDGPGSLSAARARAQMEATGIHASAAEGAGLLALIPVASAPAVAVRVLGGFSVLRDGRPVPIGEWKSKKSRDLLKILVLRHGRPVTRDELAEVLWPDDPSDTLGNRLSVALSLLRAVLDPAKAHPADRYVTMERDAVSLRMDELSVDLQDFLGEAGAGLRELARGDREEAEALLVAAEARYAGDLLPEDLFAEWAIHTREEVRALYGQVLQVLGELAAARQDRASAARYLMRAIGLDPYDEPAHLELVRVLAAARRHGEARRAYQTYVRRMAELDIEPAQYPAAR